MIQRQTQLVGIDRVQARLEGSRTAVARAAGARMGCLGGDYMPAPSDAAATERRASRKEAFSTQFAPLDGGLKCDVGRKLIYCTEFPDAIPFRSPRQARRRTTEIGSMWISIRGGLRKRHSRLAIEQVLAAQSMVA